MMAIDDLLPPHAPFVDLHLLVLKFSVAYQTF
jgi:hypothetical protein